MTIPRIQYVVDGDVIDGAVLNENAFDNVAHLYEEFVYNDNDVVYDWYVNKTGTVGDTSDDIENTGGNNDGRICN